MYIKADFCILGAGVSGLAFVQKLGEEGKDYIILEKTDAIGGYCKTFHENGFTWDYAGHFFHFANPKIKSFFSSLLQNPESVYNIKNTKIYYKNTYIDYPFQFNIHQLEKSEFIDCLYDLFIKETNHNTGFKSMLYDKFGAAISNKFLIPYNEKLYACDLDSLDKNAMGRFFPQADPISIIRNFKHQGDLHTYNDEFFYSKRGAMAVVDVLAKGLDRKKLNLNEKVEKVDIKRKIVYTDKNMIQYNTLVNTLPFADFLILAEIPHSMSYTANQVLVFNFGFDKPAMDRSLHWIYFPEKEIPFYRVGFYSNILKEERCSIYVEIGLKSKEEIDVEKMRQNTLQALRKIGIIKDHVIVAENHVIMDPGYVHIEEESQKEKKKIKDLLRVNSVYTIGRYGDWTYCSLEDCIHQAWELSERLKQDGNA